MEGAIRIFLFSAVIGIVFSTIIPSYFSSL
jgi:hypothetical protein